MVDRNAAQPKFDVKRQAGFGAIALVSFVVLYAPIATLVLYSFNAGTSVAIWEGFSLRWYGSAWDNAQIKEAALRSLLIAAVASPAATALATMAAVATTRGSRLRGHTLLYALINQPLMVPEIVTGVALLIFFAKIKVATGYSGIGYLMLAHTAFCIPFAYLPIRARLSGIDPLLEQAAADLYASPGRAFFRVTLPLLWPGVIAGGMLSFVVSLDNIVITELVKSAGQDTLPTYMLGQLRRVITPEINAVSTLFLAASVALVTLFYLLSHRRARP